MIAVTTFSTIGYAPAMPAAPALVTRNLTVICALATEMLLEILYRKGVKKGPWNLHDSNRHSLGSRPIDVKSRIFGAALQGVQGPSQECWYLDDGRCGILCCFMPEAV